MYFKENHIVKDKLKIELKFEKLVCDYVMQTKRFEDGKSNIIKMKKKDRFYKLHDSYHKASLKLIGQFSVVNNINGELVHEDDMDFGILIN